MDIYNASGASVQFCIYEPGDQLYWLSLHPGGTARATLAAGARFSWTGAGTRATVQIVFFVNGARLGPKVVSTGAVTISAAGDIINSAPRPPTVKDAIRHVVVLVLENRSFDNVLGWLYADDANQPPRNVPASGPASYDGLAAGRYWNTVPAAAHDGPAAARLYAVRGVTDAPWHQQPNPNPREDYPSMLEQVFGTETPALGSRTTMSGFAASYSKADAANPRRVMQSFSTNQLPVLSQLARNYAVCDRWFSPLPCETWPNRSFLHAGTSFGRLNNGDKLYEDNDPVPNLTFYAGRRTVFDVLDAHRISWKVFHDTAIGPSLVSTQFWTVPQKLTRAAAPLAEFERAARAGTLPAYSFIEPEFLIGANDAHPGPLCDVRRTEQLLLRIYRALREGARWNNTLWIITADEHGGCYDHVPPPATAVPPDDSPPQFNIPGFNPFRQFGPRVPAVVVSPLIEPGTVFRAPPGSAEFDHTSILATLRDWLFRPDNGFPAVPADWLRSARVDAAPTLWPILTRSVPRTDRPVSDAPRITPLPSPPAPMPVTDVTSSGDIAAVDDEPSRNGIQIALAVEADALSRVGLTALATGRSPPNATEWREALADSIARRSTTVPTGETRMKTIASFLPSTHGFTFGNDFGAQPDKVFETPLGKISIGSASNGLCGGMVFTVRDYFEARSARPSGSRPSLGHPLYDFIVDRLFASFGLPAVALKYYDWMCTSDHDTLLKTGVGRRTIIEEWPRIRAELDADRPCCLGLVTVFSLNPGDLGQNHQVLAYGYDVDSAQNLTLRLYDPNSPRDDGIALSLNLSRPGGRVAISHNVNIGHPVRGFFVVPYAEVTPPQYDDAEVESFLAPQAIEAGATAGLVLKIVNTGTTTWTPAGANPYRLGSQSPQDNNIWGRSRVDLPETVAPGRALNLSFPVSAPGISGSAPLQMGWRMVHEGQRWFGARAGRVITVFGRAPPTDPCRAIRDQIASDNAEIADLQNQLDRAVAQRRAVLVAQIRSKQAEISQLKRQATAQGCRPTPP